MELLRPKKIQLSLDMAPLIDVVFQLLIFFMLSSSFLNPSLDLKLPQAAKSGEIPRDSIIVSVDKQGSIFVNHTQVQMEELRPHIENLLKGTPKTAVQLQADENMPYRTFVGIMDRTRQAGASQINIAHSVEGSR